MLRGAFRRGREDALRKLGFNQPAPPSSVAPRLPTTPGTAASPLNPASIPSLSRPPNPGPPKIAFNVGMGASTSTGTEAAGAVRGEPADTERRQRSVIDRAFQQNEDSFATSASPQPGMVSP